MGPGHLHHSLVGVDGQIEEGPTYGDMKLPTERVYLAFRSGSPTTGDGEYAPAFNMLELSEGSQGFDRHD